MSNVVTLPRESVKSVAKKVHINREMVARRREKTYEECVGMDMTPAQKEVFLIVDACDDGFGLVDTSNYPSRQGSWNHV